ncbi:MAG: hypothetical protein Kow0059_02540 [Candidatus Sumerlaeia bacterium]
MGTQRERFIEVNGERWERLPIRTHLITKNDDIVEVIDRYTKDVRRPGDLIAVSEKVVAVSQGRAIPESELKIGLLARVLWRFVSKVPYGVGLRRPSSMQCAINECGAWRILLAAVIGGLGKLVGRRGDFYRIAGMQAATIDAAGTSPLQPDCVIMGPRDPDRVAERIRERTGCPAAVMDINDIGGSWALGVSAGADKAFFQQVLRDNPWGQKDEQTPVAIIRRAVRQDE